MGFVPILSLKVGLAVMCSEKVQEKYRCEFIHFILFILPHITKTINTNEREKEITEKVVRKPSEKP